MGAFGFGFAALYVSPLASEPEIRDAMGFMGKICGLLLVLALVAGGLRLL